jgi:hypothetical protein
LTIPVVNDEGYIVIDQFNPNIQWCK